jgi:hypothetical protein
MCCPSLRAIDLTTIIITDYSWNIRKTRYALQQTIDMYYYTILQKQSTTHMDDKLGFSSTHLLCSVSQFLERRTRIMMLRYF